MMINEGPWRVAAPQGHVNPTVEGRINVGNIALINDNDKSHDSNSVSRKLGILCETLTEGKVVMLTNGLRFELEELISTHWIYYRLSEAAKRRLSELQSIVAKAPEITYG